MPSLQQAEARIAANRGLYPNVLGIGAAKAGTTDLAARLAMHPQVCLPAQKELNVLRHGNCLERLGEYEDFFADAGERPVRMDFSVSYLASAQASTMAARLFPDARLVVVLRNPVDQVQSHYWHLRRQNFHQWTAVTEPPGIVEALDRFPDLLLEPALYGKHLARWLEHFDVARLHVVEFEAYRRSPVQVLDRLGDFLGIDPFAPADRDAGAGSGGAGRPGRAGVSPRSARAERVYNALYSGLARGPYQWLKSTFGVRFADALKRRLRVREAAEAAFFRSGYAALDRVGREAVAARFAADIDLLEAVTGRTFPEWRKG